MMSSKKDPHSQSTANNSVMLDSLDLSKFVSNISQLHEDKHLDAAIIWKAIRSSLSVRMLIDNLAEAFRVPPDRIEKDLKGLGFNDLIVQYNLHKNQDNSFTQGNHSQLHICSNPSKINPFPNLFKITAKPDLLDPIYVSEKQKELFSSLFHDISVTSSNDPFLKLYRENIQDYFNDYMTNNAPKIIEYINQCFHGGYPKYMVTTGIGANEQFNHYVSAINNKNTNRRVTWLIINSPKRLSLLPEDACLDNTLFMEFSRSSVTEETVKIHEYTPRKAHRIVFCNRGPLLALGQRDGNLIQSLPDQVAGRFGRNNTPILLAPMHVAGMDIETFWKDIQTAIDTFDISDSDSLPMMIAKYIFLFQRQKPKNLIYLGCNDDNLLRLADEFVQFWNEGVNKDKNDLLVSRFFGLPRDSHMNIEGLLGNHDSKIAFFLLRTNMRSEIFHPLVSQIIDPIEKNHEGLHYGDEEVILSYANYMRFSDLMPTILLEVPCKPSLKHAAIIGQLFADITFLYSRLNGLDPGSNPEVKAVRERSANLLSEVAEKIRNGYAIEEGITK